jgi:serine-type D-Ala-D-Ala carboxypeptidase/endopeptidase (penicillin-binding protein 4)
MEKFLADSLMKHSTVSLSIIESETGNVVYEHNPQKSLSQASILKLVTTATALEMLGNGYTFRTKTGYTGKLTNGSRTLEGDIIIKGGGDPALGSANFPGVYEGFIEKWVDDIKALGLKKITGRVIADDSYYDYEPIPSGWSWDDIGNYYGAGANGLTVFDNTFEIHFKTGEKGSVPVITKIFPLEIDVDFTNYLTASGTTDNGYIYLPPYSNKGWISGTIPENKEDFILKGSIPDPALLLSKILTAKLREAGVKVIGNPLTARLMPGFEISGFNLITETVSPTLSAIIDVLNHKSVNLYAEHLIRELGKVIRNTTATSSGAEVITEFLDSAGINTEGMFISDGSGLSSLDAVNSSEMVKLLMYMKKKSLYFEDYYRSLPEPGKEGTLKNYFRDPVFETRLRAKSGSLTRVRSYAGYFTTMSGKEMIFCIIVNNYNGPSRKVISGIEEILKETILNR